MGFSADVSPFLCTFQGGRGRAKERRGRGRGNMRPFSACPSIAFCIPMLKEERIRSLCKIDDRDPTPLQRKKEHGRRVSRTPFFLTHCQAPSKSYCLHSPLLLSLTLCPDLPICSNCRWDDRRKEERKKSLANVQRISLHWQTTK